MKQIITSVAITTIVISLQADFSFGDMFKDMKEVATNMSKDINDSGVSIKNGVVETGKNKVAEDTNKSISDMGKEINNSITIKDMNNSVDSVSHNVTKPLKKLSNGEKKKL